MNSSHFMLLVIEIGNSPFKKNTYRGMKEIAKSYNWEFTNDCLSKYQGFRIVVREHVFYYEVTAN